eukprot:6363049-Amphidinium_carterae.1
MFWGCCVDDEPGPAQQICIRDIYTCGLAERRVQANPRITPTVRAKLARRSFQTDCGSTY